MADNYLEKQYAEYEARKAAWEKAKKHGKRKASITSPSTQIEQSTPKGSLDNKMKK
jgi:hypothetical protein